MPSPRFRLWQVLRDEYQLFHGLRPNLIHDWSFRPEQLKHPIHLALRLREPADAVSKDLLSKLNQSSREELKDFDGSQHPSDLLKDDVVAGLNALLADPTLHLRYEEAVVANILSEIDLPNFVSLKSTPLKPDAISQLNRWLIEETYSDELESIDQTITRDYYREIHTKNHSALCLSGGGIRSATFNLGLLQGLARHGLLEEFEYLSTVSGGGFSGGWLTAWIRRHPEGLEGVVRDLGKQDPTAPTAPTAQKPLEPEPEALSWLRSYSNFVSPKLGLFSADTWTLVATVLRNIFLNWLVFVPVLMAVLMLPRLWLGFVARRTFDGAEDLSISIGFISGLIALLYIGFNLPSTQKRNRGQAAFLLLCLLPLIISAVSLATYVMRASQQGIQHDLGNFVFYQIAIISLPWIVCALYQLRIRRNTTSRAKLLLHYLVATLLIVVVQIVTACLLWRAAVAWSSAATTGSRSVHFYACFSIPVILALLAFTGVLLAGLTSNYTEDEDQEWWARAGAWIFITIIGWTVLNVLVIYGPQLLVDLPKRLSDQRFFSTEVLVALGGIMSGVVALSGGFSARAPATDQEASKSGLVGKLVQLLTSVAAAVFLVFIIIVLTLVTNVLLVTVFEQLALLAPWQPFAWLTAGVGALPGPYNHWEILLQSPARLLVLLMAILLFVGYLFGRLVNTNKFSLHYLWRNRIIRGYLGASNPNRRPNRFTGFDKDDNLRMHELGPTQQKKLLHVLNFALNLVGGEKLAWQERKAESFSVSPLHCGNHHLGYRRAESYGARTKPGDAAGKHGISLGTSIAISGAFVSPNMGYMQTSPVVRFLMTLFNVRFGWWLGNPGRAGDGTEFTRTYDLNSPRLSVKPIVKEALGMTNDRSDYIYLSDGGHFENFGLYEMVLRRCRLIVVGDATSDAEYAFESLGQSLRKIRVDFGIPVEFEHFRVSKPSRDGKGVYAAIGTIRYSCIDGGNPRETDGTLLLIKPTLVGSESRDVLNYASQSGSFPQEFIGDQWFSESQFESYRALGSHIIDALCREPKGEISDNNTFPDLEEFTKRVKDNLSPESGSDFGQRALDYLRKNIP